MHLRRIALPVERRRCYERLAVRNFDTQPRRLRLGLPFAADFADLFEVRGTTRERRGTLPSAGR